MGNIKEIMTFKEAAERWGISGAALRFVTTTKRLTEGIDYRKSGGTWLISRKAMEKLYGKENNL